MMEEVSSSGELSFDIKGDLTPLKLKNKPSNTGSRLFLTRLGKICTDPFCSWLKGSSVFCVHRGAKGTTAWWAVGFFQAWDRGLRLAGLRKRQTL